MRVGQRIDALIVAVLVAVLLGVFLVLWWRNTTVEPQPETVTEPVDVATRGDRQTKASSRASRPVADLPEENASAVNSHGKDIAPAEEHQTAAEPQAWVRREPATFSEEDLQECGNGIVVDVGRYNTRKDEEFEVGFSLSGPALESCTVVVDYDPQFLQVIPKSATPIGRRFRSGIECYADEASGTLILVQSGEPGSKNLDSGTGNGLAAVWRMRALKTGSTQLTVGEDTSFTNGCGEEESYRTTGGDVTVR